VRLDHLLSKESHAKKRSLAFVQRVDLDSQLIISLHGICWTLG
jgi:hypothetical protein